MSLGPKSANPNSESADFWRAQESCFNEKMAKREKANLKTFRSKKRSVGFGSKFVQLFRGTGEKWWTGAPYTLVPGPFDSSPISNRPSVEPPDPGEKPFNSEPTTTTSDSKQILVPVHSGLVPWQMPVTSWPISDLMLLLWNSGVLKTKCTLFFRLVEVKFTVYWYRALQLEEQFTVCRRLCSNIQLRQRFNFGFLTFLLWITFWRHCMLNLSRQIQVLICVTAQSTWALWLDIDELLRVPQCYVHLLPLG